MDFMGKVFLVGAGPGDPDLLTVKAFRLIQAADVVVYDRLVGSAILKMIPPETKQVFVGKRPGNHHVSQEQINRILAELAQENRCVVRLKGGDPFIFGRGGEEALHLLEAGVDFEIVPGISAASGCGALIGLPLTHRGLSKSVQFVTGHCRANVPLDLDWDSLALNTGTVVFYMGLANLDQIRDNLIARGKDPKTPVAAIENGATPQQRICVTDLISVEKDLRQRNFKSPTLLIIGDVVQIHEILFPKLQQGADKEPMYATKA